MYRSRYLRRAQPARFEIFTDPSQNCPASLALDQQDQQRVYAKDDPLPVPPDLYLVPNDEFRTYITLNDIDHISTICLERSTDLTFQPYFFLINNRLFTWIADTLSHESASPFCIWLASSIFKHIVYWVGYQSYEKVETLNTELHTFLSNVLPTFELLVEEGGPHEILSSSSIRWCRRQERSLTESIFRAYPALITHGQIVNQSLLQSLVPLLTQLWEEISPYDRIGIRDLIKEADDVIARGYIDLDLIAHPDLEWRKEGVLMELRREERRLREVEKRALRDVSREVMRGERRCRRGRATDDGWGMEENMRLVEDLYNVG